MSYGFIYYATNPSMPGVTKIGMSTKHPRIRLAELSAATACPQPFELLAFFDCKDPCFTESAIHADLARFRVNNRREFFAVSMMELQDQMRQWGNPSEGCYFSRYLDFLVDQELVAS